MRGIYKGNPVDYIPGKLVVGIRKGFCHDKATEIIESFGGKVLHIDYPDVADVAVDPRNTLDIAESLSVQSSIRFVTPVLLERRQYDNESPRKPNRRR